MSEDQLNPMAQEDILVPNDSLALRLSGVTVNVGGEPLLGPLELSLKVGAHLLLVGPSGSGKTSLLRAIAGLGEVTGGLIDVLGQKVHSGPNSLVEPQHRGVGLLFQGGALWPHMTVRQTIDFVLTASKVPRKERKPRREKLLELVELKGMDKRSVPTLSGGEAQRLALARALATEPGLLLLDEPLGPLDQELRQGLLKSLDRLRRELHLTIVHVTHDESEARSLATAVARLDKGQLEVTALEPQRGDHGAVGEGVTGESHP